jgi:hypothetical protein
MQPHARGTARATLGALAGGFLLAVIPTACSDQAPGGAGQATLSFQVVSSASAALADNIAAIIVEGGGHTVDLESADVVFGKVKFERVDDDDNECDDDDDHEDNSGPGSSNSGSGSAHGDCDDDDHDGEFRAGAITVSLPLEGGLITPFNGQLPAGTYDELEMKADFVRVRGTFDGEPFDVTVAVHSKLEMDLEPPLEITETSETQNVSVDIDVASWFKDAAGNAIDPRLVQTDPVLRAQFQRRVRASFRAFDDDDCDGRRDGHHGDDDDNSGPGGG